MATATSGVVSADSDYLSTNESKKSSSNNNELGKDAFIKLLVTQMQYQDPMNPMDNSQMIAQLAQFTALEQMMNVAQSNQRQLANSMIGKYVEYLYKDEATGKSDYYTGKVDYATITGDTPMLGIGDQEVKLSDVCQVFDGDNIQSNSSAFDVIGKTVQATMTEKNAKGENESVVVEGEVQGIKMVEGKPYILIGTDSGKQLSINYESVQNIVENTSVTGRKVTAKISDADGNSKVVSGIAQYIKVTSEGTYVYVDGQLINYDAISTIDNSDNTLSNTSAYDAIGKTVRAAMTEKNAKGEDESVVIEGKVQSVQMVNGKPYVLIGEEGGNPLSINYESVQTVVTSSNVVGRNVTANVKDSEGNTKVISGVAQYTKTTSDGTYVYVGGQLINFKDISTIA